MMALSGGMLLPYTSWQYFCHSPHTLTQYLVSAVVFSGTASSLFAMSSSVMGAANLALEEVHGWLWLMLSLLRLEGWDWFRA